MTTLESKTRPRRRNRTVDDEVWIRTFLKQAPTGVLATVEEEQPFAHPNLFLFDEAKHAVYFHTAKHGRTRSNLEGESRACFTVFEMGRLLPAEKIIDFSTEYASVMIFGRVSIVRDIDEMRSALQAQVDKYFPHKTPGQDYAPFTDAEMLRATMYRLDIEAWSAKQNKQPAEYPGAFEYVRPEG